MDICDHDIMREKIMEFAPDVIVNAAAYTAVDRAESEAEAAFDVNAAGVKNLANIAKSLGCQLIHYSTDYVFDGTKSGVYTEEDATNPLNVYGKSKLASEHAIRESGCRHLIFRTTWVIGSRGNNFAKTILRLAGERDTLDVVADQRGVPTSATLIAGVTAQAIAAIKTNQDWGDGLYNLTPSGETTWHELACRIIEIAHGAGLTLRANKEDIKPISTAEYPTPAQRPMNSVLDTQKLRSRLAQALPTWQDDFAQEFQQIIEVQSRAAA
jgi:dTDP-4-dehydrorhamnose reductase